MKARRAHHFWQAEFTPPSMHYVYVLWKDGNWYIGYTNNLKRRIKEHRQTHNVRFVYCEIYATERPARIREQKLKHHGSAWRAVKKRISA